MPARRGPGCTSEEKYVCQQGVVCWFSNVITTWGGKEEISAASFYCIYIDMDLFHPFVCVCVQLPTELSKMTKK